jgi:hypothetical protein
VAQTGHGHGAGVGHGAARRRRRLVQIAYRGPTRSGCRRPRSGPHPAAIRGACPSPAPGRPVSGLRFAHAVLARRRRSWR